MYTPMPDSDAHSDFVVVDRVTETQKEIVKDWLFSSQGAAMIGVRSAAIRSELMIASVIVAPNPT
jgi:hypothetical protein